ncbi:MAG: asparagine synthase (glutamine-hydrolyzing) [Oscillospiraceae bacterium]|nr:asparagine synthase (glutamine-hydrolyzing) [Oscillospiraceae bacterium]
MCGFTGFVSRGTPELSPLRAMADTIVHRGPDDEGYYIDEHCAIAHRRLSIIDLAGGHQPMISGDGRYVLAYNGEVYNFMELREQLIAEGCTFETRCDSEVILQGYVRWGAEVTKKLRGMFAFVIWDKQEQSLYGARDIFGIKPFYYAPMGDTFFFGSELKSFLPHPDFKKELNREALKFYLTFQYSALNESFLKGVFRLEPGHQLVWKANSLDITAYNTFSFDPDRKSLQEHAQEIRDVVTESVEAHQISDVEVGAFLSGGIDSSVIVALSRPDKTYSVGFANKGFDETGEAQALCRELGLKNISKTISADEFFDALPNIQYYADEPNANLSTVPLYFLSRLAAKDVKVVLSGEGSDELFGGYITYHTTKPYRVYRKLPLGVRKVIARKAAARPPFHGQGFLTKAAQDIRDNYVGQAFIFDNDEAERLLTPAYRSEKTWKDITAPYFDRVEGQDDLTKKQYLDLHLWQPLDILRKADRMTMASSLELRVPYLDRKVWEVARRIPSSQKMRGKSTTKYPLRVAAVPMLPDDWIKRPKVGFPVPFIEWLRQEKYYNWAKELLSQPFAGEFFDQAYLLELLEQHYSGQKRTHRKLYTVLSFLIWYQVYFPERCGKEPFVPTK